MTAIADLQAQLAAAKTAELESLDLGSVRERIDAADRRAERLAGQLAALRAERQELVADRDARIRQGAAAGLTATELAEAAGITRSRAAQVIEGGVEDEAVPDEAVPAA